MSPDAVLRQRRDLCRDLLAFSQRQDELISAADYSGLLTLLGEKQDVLERFARLKRDHHAVWNDWRSVRDGLDESTRACCESLLSETESDLATLLAREDASTKRLSAKRDSTRLELVDLDDGSRVNVAYRDALAPSTHRHLNLDG